MIDEIQNSILFVLLGIEAMAIAFDATAFLAGLGAIFSVNVVRLGAVAGVLALHTSHPARASQFNICPHLGWSSRRPLHCPCALGSTEALGRSWILGATYLMVVFSIVIQGGSMDWLLRLRNRRQEMA